MPPTAESARDASVAAPAAVASIPRPISVHRPVPKPTRSGRFVGIALVMVLLGAGVVGMIHFVRATSGTASAARTTPAPAAAGSDEPTPDHDGGLIATGIEAIRDAQMLTLPTSDVPMPTFRTATTERSEVVVRAAVDGTISEEASSTTDAFGDAGWTSPTGRIILAPDVFAPIAASIINLTNVKETVNGVTATTYRFDLADPAALVTLIGDRAPELTVAALVEPLATGGEPAHVVVSVDAGGLVRVLDVDLRPVAQYLAQLRPDTAVHASVHEALLSISDEPPI